MDNLTVSLVKNDKTTEERINEYNPYRIPPDIELAKIHGIARRVCYPQDASKSEKSLKCPCCELPIDNKQIRICCPLDDLAHLGVCFPQYFIYIKFCFLILCLCFGVAGIVNLIFNLLGSNCHKISNTFICRMSFLNVLDTTETGIIYLRRETMFNVIAIFVVIISFEIFRNYQRKFAYQYRPKYSITNFALLLSFLPKQFTKDDIEGFLNYYLEKIGSPPTKIVEMYYLHQLGEYAKLFAKKKNVILKSTHFPQKRDIYLLKLKELNKMLKDIEDNYGNQSAHNNSRVIVVLEHSEAARALHAHFRKKVIYNVATYVHNYLGFKPLKEKHLYKGSYIKVAKAPEPSDITWENLSYPSKLKTTRRFMTAIIASLLITLGFVALFLLKKSLKEVQQEVDITEAADTSQYVSIVISLLAALCVAITNTILGIFIRKFVRYEKHKTYTNYFVSVGRRITAALVLNMTLTTMLANAVHYSNANSWENFAKLSVTGLFYDVFFLFITNSYMSSIFNFFDIMWGLRLYRRRKAIKLGDNCKLTQTEANTLFEGHPVDMALRFANVNKTLIFTGLFAPFIPIGLILSLIGFLIVYWIDKYLLLRRYVCANKLSDDLPKAMLGTAEWFIVAYAFGNFFTFFVPLANDGFVNIKSKYEDVYFWISLAAFLIALIYKFFIPANFIHRYFLKIRQPKEDDTYESVSGQLPEQYNSYHLLFKLRGRDKKDIEDEETRIFAHDLNLTTPSHSMIQPINPEGRKILQEIQEEY